MAERGDARRALEAVTLKNLNTLIIGATGTGKTTFARRLLSLSPRAVVLDRMEEYDEGAVFYSFRESVEFFRGNLRDDFHIIYRGENQIEFFGWLDIIFQAQSLPDMPPIGVFLEEASFYSTSHELDPILENVVTKGRRRRISVVSVVQWEAQQNPVIRANSTLWIALRQVSFQADTKQRFSPGERDRIMALETLTPGVEPVAGRHFVTHPPGLDPEAAWSEAMTFGGF